MTSATLACEAAVGSPCAAENRDRPPPDRAISSTSRWFVLRSASRSRPSDRITTRSSGRPKRLTISRSNANCAVWGLNRSSERSRRSHGVAAPSAIVATPAPHRIARRRRATNAGSQAILSGRLGFTLDGRRAGTRKKVAMPPKTMPKPMMRPNSRRLGNSTRVSARNVAAEVNMPSSMLAELPPSRPTASSAEALVGRSSR